MCVMLSPSFIRRPVDAHRMAVIVSCSSPMIRPIVSGGSVGVLRGEASSIVRAT